MTPNDAPHTWPSASQAHPPPAPAAPRRREPAPSPATAPGRRPRLQEQVRRVMRARHMSRKTEKTYLGWIRRFILFHRRRHPAELAEEEVNAFLTHLAVEKNVSASTQTQALCALLFLYRHVLGIELGELGDLVRARRPRKLPVVLTPDEVRRVLGGMKGTPRLFATLLYGSGMRLMEGLRLRIKDLDLPYNQVTVRSGKGRKDRVTVLPDSLKPALQEHLRRVLALHQQDLSDGYGRVPLPHALARKYPGASREWCWQYVFPATTRWRDPAGNQGRHHLHERTVQRAFKAAVRQARLSKPATLHAMRSAST